MDGRSDHLDLERADAYGRSFGDVYDRWYDGVTDAESTAAFVARRHPDPGLPVLELGVGTGRLARPLARLGRVVVGLDGSAEMLARGSGRSDPGTVLPVLADMRALPFPVAGRDREREGIGRDQGLRPPFGSALLAFNTLFNLTTAADQGALLVDLARLVDPRGVVVIEMLDVSALVDGPDRSIGLRDRGSDPVVASATRLDRPRQRLWGQHVEISDRGVTLRPWVLRWVTPEQLDDLGRRAGLDLVERVGSWTGAPVTPDASTVISVYRPARGVGPGDPDEGDASQSRGAPSPR